ncbi:hypothetical protein NM688_g4162 [Phlebia brevispora]|uniref:Uncharacterized protein n=1 Tax=Phlebia brevispora TaxID=194682 RepID=A0ACC1T3U8_9APHY|nr:hypothetical protein NM688_g4162 [Phlebia brevispora]
MDARASRPGTIGMCQHLYVFHTGTQWRKASVNSTWHSSEAERCPLADGRKQRRKPVWCVSGSARTRFVSLQVSHTATMSSSDLDDNREVIDVDQPFFTPTGASCDRVPEPRSRPAPWLDAAQHIEMIEAANAMPCRAQSELVTAPSPPESTIT